MAAAVERLNRDAEAQRMSILQQYSLEDCSTIYVNDRQLTKNQIKIINKIIRNNYESNACRNLNFCMNRPRIVGHAFVPTSEDVRRGIRQAAATATVVGTLVLPFGTPVAALGGVALIPVLPYGVAVVGGVVVVATTIAYGFVTAEKIRAIRNNPRFREWQEHRTNILKNSSVKKYILKDEQLKFFICPLSKTLPLIPVRFEGCQQAFDVDALMHWIETKGSGPNAKPFPALGRMITIEETRFDFEHAISITDRLQNLKVKTLGHIDQDAYVQNLAVEKLLSPQAPIDVKKLVLEYIDLSSHVTVLENGTFDVIRQRQSNTLLERITNLIDIAKDSIKDMLLTSQEEYRNNLEATIAAPVHDVPSIDEQLRSLNKRKIVSRITHYNCCVFRWNSNHLWTINLMDPNRFEGQDEYPIQAYSHPMVQQRAQIFDLNSPENIAREDELKANMQ